MPESHARSFADRHDRNPFVHSRHLPLGYLDTVLRSIIVTTTAGLVLAGCSSSGGGSSPTTSAAPIAVSAAAKRLAAKIEQGTATLTSAHLDVNAGALGGTIAGNVSFANGQTTGSDLTVTQSGSTTEVITVSGTTYGKLPSSQNTSGKPWVKVSDSSSNEFVRALAGTMTLVNAATSLGDVSKLITTATTSVKDVGSEPVGGTTTEHYALTVDPKKVSGDLASALGSTGSKALPVDLWIDGQGRPVQIKIAIPLGSQSLPLLVKVSSFNAPVLISAPPSDQVSTN
jgi:hypothetical protein